MLSLDIQAQTGDLTLNVATSIGDGVTALFGPSGCGKTTLLRAIAGLMPSEGTIRCNNVVWQNTGTFMPLHQRRVGYVFQDDRLFPHLTVAGNLQYGFRRAKAAGLSIGLELQEVVARFDLEPLLQRYPNTLSGGESRRVNIARSLCSQPQLLLLDEPLTGLDAQRKADIIPYLATVAKDLSIPTVYVSHINDEIAQLCDNMLVMTAGTLIDEGPTGEVLGRLWRASGPDQSYGDPGSLLEASVMHFDEANAMVHLNVAGQELQVISPTEPQTQDLRLFLAAADVALSLDQPGRMSIRNVLTGAIVGIRQLTGAKIGLVAIDIDLDAENHGQDKGNDHKIVAHISAAACKDLGLARGMPVYALIKSAKLTTPFA
jgi:molybdate transport system ATP-binding protein